MKSSKGIHYEIQGDAGKDAPWLTLSHSLATTMAMWQPQLDALTRHFTVLRYDTRGHGGSDVGDGPYTFAGMCADVLDLWDELGVARSHFVGISMGGMIGQHLALMAPERLDRLVLMATSSTSSASVARLWQQRAAQVAVEGMEAMVEGSLGRWFTEPFRLEEPALMATYADMIRQTPAAGYIACGRMIPSHDTLSRLPTLTLPTMVMAGDQDGGTTPEMAAEIAAAIPGARLEVIAQAAHLLNVEQTELVNALLLAHFGAFI